MIVRGPAFLARQALVVEEHGLASWEGFLRQYSKRDPYFLQAVSPIGQIPAEKYLAVSDALIGEFYGGDTHAHWRFGEKSAQWSFTRGQNKTLFKPGEWRRFALSASAIWGSYYDAGRMTAAPGDGSIDVRIEDVPLPHVGFEYSAMGYMKGGIEFLGVKEARFEALEGYSIGHRRVHYRFVVK